MKWNSPTFCELCCKKLVGVAEINSMIDAEENVIVTVKESKVIDWAFCKLCRSVVCQESCFDCRTGYCQPCAKEFGSRRIPDSDLSGNFNEDLLTDDILSSEIIF